MGSPLPDLTDPDRTNDDVRDWFERGELASCPRCGADAQAVTSIGALYCLGCGELVCAPSDDCPRSA